MGNVKKKMDNGSVCTLNEIEFNGMTMYTTESTKKPVSYEEEISSAVKMFNVSEYVRDVQSAELEKEDFLDDLTMRIDKMNSFGGGNA